MTAYAQPPHTPVDPDADDPQVFNPAIADLRSQYGGNIGAYWTTHGMEYGGGGINEGPSWRFPPGAELPGDRYNPEICGEQYIGLVAAVHGQIWGDINAEYQMYAGDGVDSAFPGFITDAQVSEDVSPRFYPPCSPCWPNSGAPCYPFSDPSATDDLGGTLRSDERNAGKVNNKDQSGKRWTYTPGKPWLIRQRGNKLWVMTIVGIGWDETGLAHWSVSFGGGVFVSDITETEEHNLNLDPQVDGGLFAVRGKKWETQYERTDLDKTAKNTQSYVDSEAPAVPAVPHHMAGVGNDVLLIIDDQTYQNNDWLQFGIDVQVIDPYRGEVGWGVTPWYRNPGEIPGTSIPSLGFSSDPHGWIFPTRPAPRDAPWCVGTKWDYTELWCGTVRMDAMLGPEENGDQFEEILQVTGANETRIAFPDQMPWSFDPGSWVPAVAEPVLVHASATPESPVEGAVECRGYDRLPANEYRGAIDCVLWHEGIRIWNLHQGYASSGILGVDPWKTISIKTRVNPEFPLYPMTAAGVWIRRHDKDGGDPIIEEIDLISAHDREDSSIPWIPLATTLTPFGDCIYLLITGSAGRIQDTLDAGLLPGRRFLIVRPNYWEINVRVPVIRPTEYYFPESLPRGGGTNYFGDLSHQWPALACTHQPIRMSANEHWLYLNNFPQRCTPTRDERSWNGDFYYGDLPDERPIIDTPFQTYPNFVEPDGVNLGGWDTYPGWWKYNVWYDWQVDINTGRVRVPWRSQYSTLDGEMWAPHSIFGSFRRSMDMDRYIDYDNYDYRHQNKGASCAIDTMPKVIGTTPTPAFH